jgi:hypothetical protein
MRILIVSQYFWPENMRINDLACSLQQRGHQVTVFTGKPNYPAGEYFQGYSLFSRSREHYEGMEVVRIPLLARGQNSRIKLALNYACFDRCLRLSGFADNSMPSWCLLFLP